METLDIFKKGNDIPPIKKYTIIKEDTSKAEYSAKKISANIPPPYSVLNPETNSDSLSEKSKGARWVSAKTENPHRGKIGSKKNEAKETLLML
jgi:hypothetical protein